MAWAHHLDPKKDFMSEVMDLLDSSPLDAAAADAKVSDDSKEADEAKVHSRPSNPIANSNSTIIPLHT